MTIIGEYLLSIETILTNCSTTTAIVLSKSTLQSTDTIQKAVDVASSVFDKP